MKWIYFIAKLNWTFIGIKFKILGKSDVRKVTTRKFTFSEYIMNAEHEMRPMEETMTILHFEHNLKRINALGEIEIMKATTSDHVLNIIQNNNPLYWSGWDNDQHK